MSISVLISWFASAVLPSYYAPVYVPPPIIYPVQNTVNTFHTTDQHKILDRLPKDSTIRNGRISAMDMDTLGLMLPKHVELDTLRAASDVRPDSAQLARMQAWADSTLAQFTVSSRARFARSGHLDSAVAVPSAIRIGDSVPPGTLPLVVVESFRLRPLNIGSGFGLGSWIGNIELTWGVWDPQRRTWILRGKRSLRTTTSEIRDIPSAEAAEYLAKEVYQPSVPRTVADPTDASRRKMAYGGLHILGDLGFGMGVEGDSRKLARDAVDSDARLSLVDVGAHALWVPGWFGIGAGYSYSSMEVRVDKQSESLWDINTVYGIFSAFLPTSKGNSQVDRHLLNASLNVGRVSYATGKIWNGSADGSGLFYRPEVGWTMVSSAFIVGLTMGMQFQSATIEELELADKCFRMGMQLGFRAGYR